MKQLYFKALLLLLVAHTSFSQVNTSSGNWLPIGNVVLTTIYDDADNGDGALFVDGQSSVIGQGAAYTFGGTMLANEEITISTFTYNKNSSYVYYNIELYNKTDNRVLQTSSVIQINGNDTTPINTVLSYTTLAIDAGDELQARYIRTDNGNSARDFAIDNLILTGPCPFTVTPDLALIASNATIEAEIVSAVNRFSNNYLGMNSPSTVALSSAEIAYTALNINVSGSMITGNSITSFNNLGFLKTFAQHLKFNPTDSNIQTKANNAVWWISKQFCSGTIPIDNQLYAYEDFARPTILMKDFLQPTTKGLFEYTLYEHSVAFEHFWQPVYNETYQASNNGINTDMVYNIGDVLLAYSLWQNTADERYRYMRAYKRYMDRFFTYTSGTAEGLKPDGTGFHHWVAYNNYMYSFNAAADILSYLTDTSFQVEQTNYKVFRDAFITQFIQSNDYFFVGGPTGTQRTGTQALSSAGRNPQTRTNPLSQSTFKTFAITGGNILGLATADPALAGVYNRIFGVDEAFNHNKISPFESGFFQFNHAMAGVFRKEGTVVFNKGFSNNMWGTEAYANQNRYGRYQSYGALEVIYPGDKAVGNGYDDKTWDWNFNPGTTVIRLPWSDLHAEWSRLDELQQKRFVGSISLANKNSELLKNIHGSYGMFAMDFQEKTGEGFGTNYSSNKHNSTFTFKKSNFYFDDIIVCLGSGISNNDTSNETVTTLFQRLDNKAVGVHVNGINQTATGLTTYSGSSNNWLISNYGTGFYLVSGNDGLVIKKELQQTPNQNQTWLSSGLDFSGNAMATYYTGYINHGKTPSNKGYEYILTPNSNSTDMQALNTAMLSANKPYIVHQKDANAHIVQHVEKNIWGYAFFESATNVGYDYIKAVNGSSLLMTEFNSSNNTLLLSVNNPDIGLSSKVYTPSIAVTREVILAGTWTLNTYYPGVQVSSSSNATQTVLEFTLVDGLAKEVLLNATTYVNLDYPIVYYEDFSSDTGHGFAKVVVNTGGQALGDIMKRVADIPDMMDSNNQFDPTTDRPDNRIPEGNLRDARAISTTGNSATTNFPIDAYAIFTTLNLTSTNPRINITDTYKYASFWTQRRYGNSDIATITILATTAYTGDPTTTIWTTVPLLSGKIAETVDGLTYVNGIVDLTSIANGANGSTVTLAYRYRGSSTAYSGTNRNGIFYFSDLKFFVQSTPLAVLENKSVDDGIVVYPNPVNTILNVKLVNVNNQIEKLRLTDISGKIIYNKKSETIDVSVFSQGIYFLSIETNTGKIITKKVAIN